MERLLATNLGFKGKLIDSDLKNSQFPVSNGSIPKAIIDANTRNISYR